MKKLLYGLIALTLFIINGCSKNYLDVLPEDRITSANFWQSESDVKLALNGIYSVLRIRGGGVYGSGPTLDACTPDAYQWAYWNGMEEQIGDGSITPSSGGLVQARWTDCYQIINQSNYFLANIDKVDLSAESKTMYTGEVHFLKGVAYALLAEAYGGVPIFYNVLTVADAKTLTRATTQQTWDEAIAEYDTAIASLNVVAPAVGRATKGAALGLKMRAQLYEGNYTGVLETVKEIDDLGIYSLFPSYQGMFELANEDNSGVLFDIQYIGGPLGQGNYFAWLALPQSIPASGASDPAPTQHMVDAYEMIDGSAVDPAHPYVGRDPRLDFTILRPGAYFDGLLYPVQVKNHTGQRVGFGLRKNVGEGIPITTARMSPLNFIVLRYADVLLSKAEALIETNQDIDGAIALINRIRTERNDVKITPLPMGLSQAQAREKLRHERRIEFFGEGINWADIKRWNTGPSIYPVPVYAANGSLIETKFPLGYKERDNLLPIPDGERSLNKNLTQNPGW